MVSTLYPYVLWYSLHFRCIFCPEKYDFFFKVFSFGLHLVCFVKIKRPIEYFFWGSLSRFHKVKCKPYQQLVTLLIWRYPLITFPQTQTQTLPMSTFYTDRKDFCRHYFFIQVLTKGFEENWFRFDFTSCIWLGNIFFILIE